ncbi:hypothetical protein Z948_1278 [Sulfitobacter donghicola DSW-25 = KCTC 12864 = JCM 14565]|nr:hypothetical protein Z948_1278 [Sulfitobacter donghicola DSW-25 = KCTC 12864 = JCM 14565]
MALRMCVLDQRPIHIQESDPPERPDSNPQSRRHITTLAVCLVWSILLARSRRKQSAFQVPADAEYDRYR